MSLSTTASSPYTEGDTVVLNCTFDTLSNANTTIALVTVDRDLTSGIVYMLVLSYNVSADTLDLGSFSSGAASGQLMASEGYYLVTLTNVRVADSGTYRCDGQDSEGVSPSTKPTVDVTVQG